MKNKLFLILFLLTFSLVISQGKKDSIKSNPILYIGMNLGFVNGNFKGGIASFDLNYQQKNNLFTFKYSSILDFKKLKFFIVFPIANTISETEQFSLLYGKRYVEDGFSYHFSGGISYNTTDDRIINKRFSYFGFPVEIGVNWFKSKKKKFRILYGLIPIGKPTGFGRSIGLKLHANIAKKAYVGLGLNFGIGWHKKYNNEI
ncbi:MAG: hypothetical protein V3V28_00170 [Polaribacter sp.]|uniref:hypothetical protein n=1 Tax=Polaribacter sp. TaxID=1920175 RepID=UPI002F3570C4